MTAAVENPHAGQGSVLLDIGGDVGALVVSMPASMEGVEVEIRSDEPADGHRHHPHVAVVNRPVEGGHLPSLVFPEVVEGRYGLALKESEDLTAMVTVIGGEVTTLEWPA